MVRSISLNLRHIVKTNKVKDTVTVLVKIKMFSEYRNNISTCDFV